MICEYMHMSTVTPTWIKITVLNHYSLLSIKLDNFCEIKSNYKVASGEMKLQTQKVQLWVFASKLKTVKESSYHQKIYFYTVVNGMVVRKSAQKFHWSLGFCY